MNFIKGALGLLSPVPAQLIHLCSKCGQSPLNFFLLCLCRSVQGTKTGTSYSLLNMEEVQTRRMDVRGHKWYHTCVCDKSQHQHGNGKIQSHLGYDFLRRNREQFVV